MKWLPVLRAKHAQRSSGRPRSTAVTACLGGQRGTRLARDALGKLIAYTLQVRFEWDAEKAARNEDTHGVSFEEACELFALESQR